MEPAQLLGCPAHVPHELRESLGTFIRRAFLMCRVAKPGLHGILRRAGVALHEGGQFLLFPKDLGTKLFVARERPVLLHETAWPYRSPWGGWRSGRREAFFVAAAVEVVPSGVVDSRHPDAQLSVLVCKSRGRLNHKSWAAEGMCSSIPWALDSSQNFLADGLTRTAALLLVFTARQVGSGIAIL